MASTCQLTDHHRITIKKVGEACICRLARVLALTPEVERLDLGANGLEALPDEVFRLRRLRMLDLSGACGRLG